MANKQKLILDYVYDHEAAQPGKVYLTQPLGGGQVADYTWAQMMDQARRMAAGAYSLATKSMMLLARMVFGANAWSRTLLTVIRLVAEGGLSVSGSVMPPAYWLKLGRPTDV